jgi:serine/threonine protein phosphatase PrpC
LTYSLSLSLSLSLVGLAICLGLQLPHTYGYYAIFDGHNGVNAAQYAQQHLHVHLVQNEHFRRGEIELALRDAIQQTDREYCAQDSKCGCTAVCAVVQDHKKVYVAWLGDSSALITRNGEPIILTKPHSAECEDERRRIEAAGGHCFQSDVWRVMGSLAVSRSIGDATFKPYVSGDADIVEFDLQGNEDFLVLGCDGLWDFLGPFDISSVVYEYLTVNAHRPVSEVVQDIAKILSDRAIDEGSQDNITAIVVFLRDLEAIVPRTLTNGKPLPNSFANNEMNGSNGFVSNGHHDKETNESYTNGNHVNGSEMRSSQTESSSVDIETAFVRNNDQEQSLAAEQTSLEELPSDEQPHSIIASESHSEDKQTEQESFDKESVYLDQFSNITEDEQFSHTDLTFAIENLHISPEEEEKPNQPLEVAESSEPVIATEIDFVEEIKNSDNFANQEQSKHEEVHEKEDEPRSSEEDKTEHNQEATHQHHEEANHHDEEEQFKRQEEGERGDEHEKEDKELDGEPKYHDEAVKIQEEDANSLKEADHTEKGDLLDVESKASESQTIECEYSLIPGESVAVFVDLAVEGESKPVANTSLDVPFENMSQASINSPFEQISDESNVTVSNVASKSSEDETSFEFVEKPTQKAEHTEEKEKIEAIVPESVDTEINQLADQVDLAAVEQQPLFAVQEHFAKEPIEAVEPAEEIQEVEQVEEAKEGENKENDLFDNKENTQPEIDFIAEPLVSQAEIDEAPVEHQNEELKESVEIVSHDDFEPKVEMNAAENEESAFVHVVSEQASNQSVTLIDELVTESNNSEQVEQTPIAAQAEDLIQTADHDHFATEPQQNDVLEANPLEESFVRFEDDQEKVLTESSQKVESVLLQPVESAPIHVEQSPEPSEVEQTAASEELQPSTAEQPKEVEDEMKAEATNLLDLTVAPYNISNMNVTMFDVGENTMIEKDDSLDALKIEATNDAPLVKSIEPETKEEPALVEPEPTKPEKSASAEKKSSAISSVASKATKAAAAAVGAKMITSKVSSMTVKSKPAASTVTSTATKTSATSKIGSRLTASKPTSLKLTTAAKTTGVAVNSTTTTTTVPATKSAVPRAPSRYANVTSKISTRPTTGTAAPTVSNPTSTAGLGSKITAPRAKPRPAPSSNNTTKVTAATSSANRSESMSRLIAERKAKRQQAPITATAISVKVPSASAARVAAARAAAASHKADAAKLAPATSTMNRKPLNSTSTSRTSAPKTNGTMATATKTNGTAATATKTPVARKSLDQKAKDKQPVTNGHSNPEPIASTVSVAPTLPTPSVKARDNKLTNSLKDEIEAALVLNNLPKEAPITEETF